jgi:UDP-N-acetylmuramate dehydrogenase
MAASDILKKKLGTGLETDETMSRHSTMGVGGRAKYYYEAKTVDDLIAAITVARENNIDYKVIGSGSNILVSDEGFNGLVIANKTDRLSIDMANNQIVCDSGVPLVRLITYAAEHGLAGMEPLYGIPGTVGGAIYGNAGAHGVDVSQYLRSITVLSKSGEIARHEIGWLEAQYRSTKLKSHPSKILPVILVAYFQFQPRRVENIQNDITKYRRWRLKHQPLKDKTSGSIFRNPANSSAGEKEQTAGYLLESVGAKKMKVGGAEVTAHHANWIRNADGATARDVCQLIENLKDKVADEKHIELEEEIEYLGTWH